MNYQNCTLEELAEHMLGLSSQAITQQLSYYARVGNTEIVGKIKKARLLARQMKLQEKLEQIDAE